MSKFSVHFNDYISLAVMLLMVVALIAGQADAESVVTESLEMERAPVVAVDDRFNVAFDGRIGDHDIAVTLSVATEADNFRGEDE